MRACLFPNTHIYASIYASIYKIIRMYIINHNNSHYLPTTLIYNYSIIIHISHTFNIINHHHYLRTTPNFQFNLYIIRYFDWHWTLNSMIFHPKIYGKIRFTLLCLDQLPWPYIRLLATTKLVPLNSASP